MTNPTLNEALRYLGYGWSIIPIRADSKRPAVKWAEFQKKPPTEEQVIEWWEAMPLCNIGLVTGSVSGIVVVDCDNDDAYKFALANRLTSPVEVRTRRGTHIYFKHPMDGRHRGPRTGREDGKGSVDWPQVKGLDFRGDAGYVVLPPAPNYSWQIAPGGEFEDLPVWIDWEKEKPDMEQAIEKAAHFTFGDIDLKAVVSMGTDEHLGEWEKTANFVRDNFPHTKKIPTGLGNDRNNRVTAYLGECLFNNCWGEDLRIRGEAYMNEFFEDNLDEFAFNSMLASLSAAEKRNHPEKFDADGKHLAEQPTQTTEAPVVPQVKQRTPIQMKDADRLLDEAAATEYLIEPWLTRGCIVQVFGYSGHGKSLFVQHAMGAMTAGRESFGPFEIPKPMRVLYMDFEMGKATVGERLIDLHQAHGHTGDRLNIWTPFIDEEINLLTVEGRAELEEWIKVTAPDVIVLDTLRTAFPGLEENDAPSWKNVHSLSLRLRNAGYGVILMHHSNKPTKEGLGNEAGSSNQLTVLETQIRVTQVFDDKDTAKSNGGIFDGDMFEPKFPLLEKRLHAIHGKDYRIDMVMEIRYVKVRGWTHLHDRQQWIAICSNDITGEKKVVSNRSSKQRAKEMASTYSPMAIARELKRPIRIINEWLGIKP